MGKLAKSGIVIAIVGVLIATASWAVYRMINQGAGDMLSVFGITNIYYQSMIVVVVVILLLLLTGMLGKKSIKKILRIN